MRPNEAYKRPRTAHGQPLPPAGNVVCVMSESETSQHSRSPRRKDHAERFRAFRSMCRQNLKAQNSLGSLSRSNGILEIRVASSKNANVQRATQTSTQASTSGADRRRRQKRRRETDYLEMPSGSTSHPRQTSAQAGSLSPSPQPGSGAFSPPPGSATHPIGTHLTWSGHQCRIHSINPGGSYNLMMLRNNSILKGLRLPPPQMPQSFTMPTGNFGFAPT